MILPQKIDKQPENGTAIPRCGEIRGPNPYVEYCINSQVLLILSKGRRLL
jgi:hypothetical protein